MPRLPKVAILGRPNVGKSALFNRICGKRIAIVDEAEGVTRDRLYTRAEFFGRPFELIDTGGIDPRSQAIFNEEIRRSALIALEEADALIFVVDGIVGPTLLDTELARFLLKTKKPVVLAINKIDSDSQRAFIDAFYSLGIETMVGVSAIQGLHMAELLEPLMDALPSDAGIEEDPSVKVAIIGRPNVGKSTLVNSLVGDERCIVSPIAGTTRDSVDIRFNVEDRPYTIIDTAGIRKKTVEREVVEKFAAIRTERAIERCDICILTLDATQGLTSYEKRIASQIEEAGKGCILFFNKWDLVHGFRMEHCQKAIREGVPFLGYCPMLFGSAITKRNLDKLFPLIDEAAKMGDLRIPTSKLNKFIEAAMQKIHPPMLQGKRLRIYYMTQIGNRPFRFLLFVNRTDLIAQSYERYLYNQFRKEFLCTGHPVVFTFRGKKDQPGLHPDDEGGIFAERRRIAPQDDEEGIDEEREESVDEEAFNEWIEETAGDPVW